MSDGYWVHLNVNEGELSIIHANPPLPQCNQKMMDSDITADIATVNRMLREGKARNCEHCNKDEPTA